MRAVLVALISPWPGICALLLLTACGSESRGSPQETVGPAILVHVVTAAPLDLPRVLPAVGALSSPETTVVASEIAGTVTDFDIPEGRAVETGHFLAALDDAEAQAATAVARARFQSAEYRQSRTSSLRAASVASEQAADEARAQLDAASGALREAQTRLEKTRIHAPFAGVLGLRQVNRGQYLEAGDRIVEITRTDPLQLEFAIPQRHAALIALGQRVLGTVGLCGMRFEGRVDAIDPQVDSRTRRLRLRATIPNPGGELWPGMSTRVRLLVDMYPGALVVPQEAIVRFGTKFLIYTLDDGGIAAQKEVQLGDYFVDGVHVTAGLERGATVVVAGHQKLRGGTLAAPQPHTPTENQLLELGWYGPTADCRTRGAAF